MRHSLLTTLALALLLGASRREDVLPIVGTALADDQLHVRADATAVLLDYWIGVFMTGGLESQMLQAGEWWDARQSPSPAPTK